MGEEVLKMLMQGASAVGRMIMQLVERIYRRIGSDEKYRREEAKIRLAEAQDDEARRKAVDAIRYKAGMLTEEEMRATGKELQPVGMVVQDSEGKNLAAFTAAMQREGIKFTMLKSDEGDFLVVNVFREDLERFLQVQGRYSDEVEMRQFYESKDVEGFLKAQQEADRRANRATEKNIIHLLDGTEASRMNDLKSMLGLWTGREYDLDRETVIAGINDPDRYITVRGETVKGVYTDTQGRQHDDIVTSYTIHGGENDGRTLNDSWRENPGWKEAIADAANESGLVYKFHDMEQYQTWRKKAKERTADLDGFMNSDRSAAFFMEMQKKLNRQAEEAPIILREDGMLYDRTTGMSQSLSQIKIDYDKGAASLTTPAALNAAEAETIYHQQRILKEMGPAYSELRGAESEVEKCVMGSPEQREAVERRVEAKARCDELEAKWSGLAGERRNIASDRVMYDVERDYIREHPSERWAAPKKDDRRQERPGEGFERTVLP